MTGFFRHAALTFAADHQGDRGVVEIGKVSQDYHQGDRGVVEIGKMSQDYQDYWK